MIEKLSPRNLRVIVAVFEEGSIARAAQRLLRAPSAIARSVHEVESVLCARLFGRVATGMMPTPAGDAAYQRGKHIEAEFGAAQRMLLDHGVPKSASLFSILISGRQMATLIKLRELGHMPSVAQALGVSQPAISIALRQVERSLDLQLFKRTPRGMHVTEVGEQLIFRLRRVMSEVHRLQADVSQLEGAATGRVTISVLPLSKTWLIPKAVAHLVSHHPKVQVSVVDAPFEALFAGLQAGEIDFLYTSIGPEFRHRDLHVQPASRERVVVVARKGHPLARKKRLDARDLARFPWVLRDPSAPSRQLLNEVFRQLGLVSPHIAVQAGDVGLLRGLLLQSDMLTAVSPRHLHHELHSGDLTILDINLPNSEREVGFVLRKDIRPSALCLLLMQEIRTALASGLPQQAPVAASAAASST